MLALPLIVCPWSGHCECAVEFFLNVSLNSVTNIFVITIKGLEPATSCVRDKDATTAPARHM